MSKKDLRRELLLLSREQLIDIIVDAYSARKEIKDYFDFFVDPDVNKLTEKYQKGIAKELSRSKWGRSKARISVINNLLKEFQHYSPGNEYVLDLYLFALQMLLYTEYQLTFTDTLYKGISRLILKTLDIADEIAESAKAIDTISNLISPETVGITRIAKRLVSNTVESYQSVKDLKNM